MDIKKEWIFLKCIKDSNGSIDIYYNESKNLIRKITIFNDKVNTIDYIYNPDETTDELNRLIGIIKPGQE